jgi:hypothetical protein
MQLALQFFNAFIEGTLEGLGLAHVFLSGWGGTMAMRDLLTSL